MLLSTQEGASRVKYRALLVNSLFLIELKVLTVVALSVSTRYFYSQNNLSFVTGALRSDDKYNPNL